MDSQAFRYPEPKYAHNIYKTSLPECKHLSLKSLNLLRLVTDIIFWVLKMKLKVYSKTMLSLKHWIHNTIKCPSSLKDEILGWWDQSITIGF